MKPLTDTRNFIPETRSRLQHTDFLTLHKQRKAGLSMRLNEAVGVFHFLSSPPSAALPTLPVPWTQKDGTEFTRKHGGEEHNENLWCSLMSYILPLSFHYSFPFSNPGRGTAAAAAAEAAAD